MIEELPASQENFPLITAEIEHRVACTTKLRFMLPQKRAPHRRGSSIPPFWAAEIAEIAARALGLGLPPAFGLADSDKFEFSLLNGNLMVPRGSPPIFQVEGDNAHEGDTTMLSKTKIALAAALIFGTASAALASDHEDQSGGSVMPGSLSGVNPVDHPGIFGNPATAKTYGFVQSSDGTWHVQGYSHQRTD